MLIPSASLASREAAPSLSRRVNANSQLPSALYPLVFQAYQEG